ncbi:MAG: hypothetical protein IPK76_11485 [Lewinellaceae bacterium]|jgi:hypothetical protein|nr:hypothetical protein [Lewinellaceae bacterium]
MKRLILKSMLVIFSTACALAQSDTELEYVKISFSGSRIFYSWEVNSTNVWSTYYETHHYCPSGYIHITGTKETTTAYTDTSRENYSNDGTWEIIKNEGQITLKIIWRNGNTSNITIEILQNGMLRFQDSLTVQYEGVANCF